METDELAQYLASLEREDCYQVDRVLKESQHEATQLVRFVGANGTTSQPLIRKIIKKSAGIGAGYTRLFAAQQDGQRFKHIPSIHECYDHDDNLVVIMEYVKGETLQEYVYRHDPSVALAANVFPQICDAVTELHEDLNPPIIHRDLKPSNIILSDKGLTLIDFGISREYNEAAMSDTTHFGTRAFAPPEQFGFGQTTVRSDVYALGMLLYFCLTEQIPDVTTLEEGFSDPRITPALREVLLQATAFDPANRFASARALKTAFLHAVNPTPNESGTALKTPDPATPATVATNFRGTNSGKPLPLDGVGETSTIGRIRNTIIVICLVIILASCIGAFIHPSAGTEGNPVWFNAVGYLLLMPLLFCSTALLLCDKTWLKRRFPRLEGTKLHQWILAYLACWGLIVLILGVLSAFK